jgi:hypothetical protein
VVVVVGHQSFVAEVVADNMFDQACFLLADMWVVEPQEHLKEQFIRKKKRDPFKLRICFFILILTHRRLLITIHH